MATCAGSLLRHRDGTVAACTEDDEAAGCAGRAVRHIGDPIPCLEWAAGCNYCGVQ